jgi:hypothetical protein
VGDDYNYSIYYEFTIFGNYIPYYWLIFDIFNCFIGIIDSLCFIGYGYFINVWVIGSYICDDIIVIVYILLLSYYRIFLLLYVNTRILLLLLLLLLDGVIYYIWPYLSPIN